MLTQVKIEERLFGCPRVILEGLQLNALPNSEFIPRNGLGVPYRFSGLEVQQGVVRVC